GAAPPAMPRVLAPGAPRGMPGAGRGGPLAVRRPSAGAAASAMLAAVSLLAATGLAAAGPPFPGASAPFVAYTVVDGARIEPSLTGVPGGRAAGRRLYADPRAGCVTCHGLPEAAAAGRAPFATAPRPGVPALDGVGGRLGAGAVRLWLVAPGFLAPGIEHSVYAVGQRTDPADPFWGGPRLTAAEVEDLVAFLAGLNGS
ncbi:MAG: c-type cytochrome, partial [Paracoccaceae bacterium]